MYYRNVFGIDNSMLLEYAYKLFKASDFEIYFLIIKNDLFDTNFFKEKLLSFGIPEKQIITKIDKKDIIENFFCNYYSTYGKKFYKIAYGMGSNEFLYRNINIYLKERKTTYFCSSEYEKQLLNNSKAQIVLGMAKYDTHYEYPSDIKIPVDKPIILFLHTWDKCKNKDWQKWNGKKFHLGISDFEHTATILEKYLNKYTIIHKNHHCTKDKSFNKFINIDSGTYDSRKLIDIADIIIADYGGSAVEAIISEKAKILYVDDDEHKLIKQNSLDAMIHNIFNHTSNKDFEKNFNKLIEEPLSNEELKLRKEWRDKLFPYLDCGAQKLANFIKKLDIEEW